MKIIVNPDMKIQELSNEFQELFPHLRLEIYNGGSEIHYLSNHKLSEFSKSRKPKQFLILPENTIRQLEDNFMEFLGLQIAVFRKEGSHWRVTECNSEQSIGEHNNYSVLMT